LTLLPDERKYRSTKGAQTRRIPLIPHPRNFSYFRKNNDMLRNYGKIAWRRLVKDKFYSLINVAGLALGITVSFILLLYVWQEYSFDKFHRNAPRLFEVFKNQPAGGEIRTKPISPEPLAATLKKDYPEVEQVARVNTLGKSLLSYGSKAIKFNTIAADSTLLDLFSFELAGSSVRGNTPARENASVSGNAPANEARPAVLTGESGIVLTRTAAVALFGAADPVGRTISFNNQFPLRVSAVIEDHPVNSSFSFEAMISWKTFEHERPWMKDPGWGYFLYATYVLLRPGTSFPAVNAKLAGLLKQYDPAQKEIRLFLYPFARLHLYDRFSNGVNVGGRIGYVRLFLILAIGILLIACINYMNLSTARSAKRAREVGVRKTMGAARGALIAGFLGESITLSLVAFLIALGLSAILIPVTNNLLGLRLHLPFDNGWAWSIGLGVTLVTGVLAGSYPAFYLSGFDPISVLKGRLTTAAAAVRPRQVLVVTQFTFAIALILVSCYIYRQVDYIRNLPVGYERTNLIEMPVEGNMQTAFENFRRDAIADGAIVDAAMTSSAITDNTTSTWGLHWPGQLAGEDRIPVDCMAVTWHFIGTYGLTLDQGRDFDPARPADSAAVILNQAAVRLMRLRKPIGREITWQGQPRKVIGVVKDFVWGSPFEPVKPAVVGYQKDWVGNIGLRLNPDQPVSRSLEQLRPLYKRYDPAYPFDYRFTDEDFSKKYSDERLLGAISLGFTVLAVFIACLGLFGLAAFSAEQRTREIGIRKVLGAGVPGLVTLLAGEFVKLVLLAFLLASAVGWYYIHRWLDRYTYHASFDAGIFVFTLVGTIAIGVAAVITQAVRAARANPVKSLRND
jgi:putative ABC transport system permease protein